MAEQEEQSFDNFVTSYTTTEASDDTCENLETTSTNDPETKLQMTPPTKRKKVGCAYNDAWKKSYPWSKKHIQQEVSTMLGVHIALNLSTSKLVVIN